MSSATRPGGSISAVFDMRAPITSSRSREPPIISCRSVTWRGRSTVSTVVATFPSQLAIRSATAGSDRQHGSAGVGVATRRIPPPAT